MYNSQAYQRESTTEEILNLETYAFPGPVVRRKTAEQLWDSLVAMVIPYSDDRKSAGSYDAGLAAMRTVPPWTGLRESRVGALHAPLAKRAA